MNVGPTPELGPNHASRAHESGSRAPNSRNPLQMLVA